MNRNIKIVASALALGALGLLVLGAVGLHPARASGQMRLLSQTELDNWWAAGGTYEKAKCENEECGTEDGNCDGEDSSCNAGNINSTCHIYKDYTKQKTCKCDDSYTEECNYDSGLCWRKYKCKCVSASDCGGPEAQFGSGDSQYVDSCGTW